jgi:phage tail sheath protein FI
MTYGRPGVYVNERLLPSPIAATSTVNAAGACLAVLEKGPSTVTLVTSWYDFVKKFGGYNAAYPATFEVSQFFRNGGAELYVRRVLHNDADVASGALKNTGNTTIGTVEAINPGNDGTNLRVKLEDAGTVGSVHYYNLAVYVEQGIDSGSTADDLLVETWRNLDLSTTTSSDYIESVVNGNSEYITVNMVTGWTGTASTAIVVLSGVDLNGTDPTYTDLIGAISDFEVLDRPLVLFTPAVMDYFAGDSTDVYDALTTWAAANRSFAVLDVYPGLDAADAVSFASALSESAFGALYYPQVYIADPLGRSRNSTRKIYSASSVAGLMLTTDRTVGPFKTPAGLNISLAGVTAPERPLTASDLNTLNTASMPVNAIRSVPGAGTVVMGGRTLLQDGSSNRYVAMRRSLNYISKRASDLTQFALFESNDETLWKRIITTLDVFLNEYRNQGGLRGNIPSDAYFIKCDETNNTETTIANGEVNIEIGVALEYPAEFVVITLTQKSIN